jgi:CRP-like cAMP-binding protein
VIDYGELGNNLYVVKEGIVRIAWFDGFKEKTFGFGLPGTVMNSYSSLVKNELSFCKLEACCPSVVMQISKAGYAAFVKESHDFAQWMLAMALEQLRFHEMKLLVVNGDARERLEALIENRPEIIEQVSYKIIASYIGISPEYFSRLKRQFMHKLKK